MSLKAGGFGVSPTTNFSLSGQTTNATPLALTIGGIASNYLTISTGKVWAFQIYVVGNKTSAAEVAAYSIQGWLKNNGGTVSGGATTAVIREDDATWDCVASANNTTKALDITVTGAANKTINWSATISITEN